MKKIKEFLNWINHILGLSGVLSLQQTPVLLILFLVFRLVVLLYSNYITLVLLKPFTICIIIINLIFFCLKFWVETKLDINSLYLKRYFAKYNISPEKQVIIRRGISALIPLLDRYRMRVMNYYAVITIIISIHFFYKKYW